MGLYKNLGIRKIALEFVELINWIRLFQFKKGYHIFSSLKKKNKEIVVEIFPDKKIYLRNNYSDSAIFKQVFLEQQYYLYHFPLEDAFKIIDAGANIGLAAIYFSELFPKAEIISIEPELENFNQLQKNLTSYTNIYCEQAAIWGDNKMVSIDNPDSLSASFMVSENNNISINGNTIPAFSIHSLMQKYKWKELDIVKMDIEGAEKDVFRNNNAFNWLTKTKLLIIELHDNYQPECSKTFFKALESFDYEAIYHNENIFIHFKHAV